MDDNAANVAPDGPAGQDQPAATCCSRACSEGLVRLTRHYGVLSAVTRIITRKPGRAELLREVCRILVDTGGFRMAWVGTHDGDGRLVPLAVWGDTTGYFNAPDRDVPKRCGPVDTAIRKLQPVIANTLPTDPNLQSWHAQSIRSGFNSMASFPVKLPAGGMAALTLHMTELDFFSPDEVQLLVEISTTIGYALESAAAEEQRSEVVLHLEHAQSLAKVGGWSADLLTGMSTNSSGACRITGLPPYPVPWERFVKFIHPDDTSRCLHAWEELLSNGRTYDLEHRITVADEVKWIHCLAELERDDTGRPVRAVGMVQDITEHKRVLNDLRMFQIFSEVALDAILMIDDAGDIRYWNPAAAQLFGYQEQEVMGRPVHSLLAPSRYHDACHAAWGRFARTGEGAIINSFREFDALGKDRAEFPIEVSLSSFCRDDRWYAVGIVRDITQRKQRQRLLEEHAKHLEQEIQVRHLAEKMLLETQDQLAGLNQELEERIREEVRKSRGKDQALLQGEKMAAIGQLAAGMAHEINNPLVFISNNLHMLQRYFSDIISFDRLQEEQVRTELSSQVRDCIAAARKTLQLDSALADGLDLISDMSEGAQRIQRIVANFRQFSVIDRQEYEYATVTECLDCVHSLCESELKLITIRKEYEAVPEIYCNHGHIHQVFLGLLRNAIQAITPPGEISLRCWSDDEYVQVAVTDTGHGIPPALLTRIFEPFFTTRDVGKGIGIGLSSAYEIVKQHHGLLQVESEEGSGSTFTVSLPRSAPALA